MILNNKAKWSSFNIILAIVGVIIALANVYGRIRKFELEVPPLHIEPCYGSSMALMALRPYITIYLPDFSRFPKYSFVSVQQDEHAETGIFWLYSTPLT